MHTHSRTHIRTYTSTNAYVHTCTHAHMHTCTHAHRPQSAFGALRRDGGHVERQHALPASTLRRRPSRKLNLFLDCDFALCVPEGVSGGDWAACCPMEKVGVGSWMSWMEGGRGGGGEREGERGSEDTSDAQRQRGREGERERARERERKRERERETCV